MATILLIEDDKDLNLITKNFLENKGFTVITSFNGLDALTVYSENKIDLILSDIMMPLMDGYGVLKNIRKENKAIPFIFMTARTDKPSKELGYEMGLDDYIVKPFDLDELYYKINAILRRILIEETKDLKIGNLKINNDEHAVYINDELVSFTVREFDILYAMLKNPKKTYTRNHLMEEFWDYDSSTTSRTVDVYMAKIRDKCKDCDGFSIETVHGLGYKVVLK